MLGPTRILATYLIYASMRIKSVAMCRITVISGIKPSSAALGRDVDHIKALNLLRKREVFPGYLREGSTLRDGSGPSEVGMSDGGIRRGAPEEVIGT